MLGGDRRTLARAAGQPGSRPTGRVRRAGPHVRAPRVRPKVCEWKEPEELKQLLDLELRNQGEASEQILARCRAVIRYSVKTCHPRFFNQLFSGWDPHALAGRIVTESLNTSQYTYEIAPVFVLMEEEVLKKLRALVGWSSGDGVFCPGGSISNMYAVNLARYQRYPDCKQRGLRALPPLALFTSKECHYSIKKGAAFLGLGTDSVRVVKTDERGKMIPEDLERQIGLAEAEGAVPFLVSATSGTTVLGAFDPLEAIADVCQRHGLWLHVDAAWGGSVLLSQTHRHLLDGIQRADSVAWNPHKLLTAGLQCSALLLRDTSNLLRRCHGSQASYLFQQDKFYDVALDTGDKVVQCGRRVDCLKLWLMWKAQGGQGLERRVDQAFALAWYLVEELKKREGFELVMEVGASLRSFAAPLPPPTPYSPYSPTLPPPHAPTTLLPSSLPPPYPPPPHPCPSHTQSPQGARGPVRGAAPLHSPHTLSSCSSQPEFVNVCFWFVPPSLRGRQKCPDYSERLAKVGAPLGSSEPTVGNCCLGLLRAVPAPCWRSGGLRGWPCS
uniref:Cysteine sulfinic acid decarboxylase n=1 Tax=Canis lupus familiaris TaxID=9615 RepID=A0A8C0TIZ4_CANLF